LNSFKPISTIKNIFIAIIKFSIILSLLTIISSIIQFYFIKGQTPFLYIVGFLSIFDIIFPIILFIVELVAIYRIAFNDRIIHDGVSQISPGWAVGYYFIPIASIYLPYKSYKYFISQMTGDEVQKTNLTKSLGTYWTMKIISIILAILIRNLDNGISIIISGSVQLIYLIISLSFFNDVFTQEEKTIESISNLSVLN